MATKRALTEDEVLGTEMETATDVNKHTDPKEDQNF